VLDSDKKKWYSKRVVKMAIAQSKGSRMPSTKTCKNELVREGKVGGIFIASYTSPAISRTNLFVSTTGALQNALPSGYIALGDISPAGAAFTRSAKTTDIASWDSDSPARTDIFFDATTLTIEPQETNQGTISLFNALVGPYALSSKGTLFPNHWRVLAVTIDAVSDTVYARFFPRALVSTYANTSEPIEYGVTVLACVDPLLSSPELFFWGGEGQASLKVDMGFDDAALAKC